MAKKSPSPKKVKEERKEQRVKKALGLIKEISDYIDKNLMNKEITKSLPMKSTQLKPFKK